MRELRIGLVLYGGVSLAIYMNGIATELWHALRASQRARGGTGDQPPLTSSAEVYRELLQRLATTEGAGALRIVVDAIAGTSAGGVNGGVLAKAIVDGGDAAVLNRVWIEEADIALLKSEPAASSRLLNSVLGLATWIGPLAELRRKIEGLPGLTWAWARDTLLTLLTTRDGSVTPLNGRYFTGMIAKIYGEMGRLGNGQALLPRRGTFDLFLTRTDLYGWPRHLPASRDFQPSPLFERTHAHVMAFRRRPPHGRLDDDFGLTFATRTTAGFPGAFPPVAYDDIAMDYRQARPGEFVPEPEAFARRHFREHDLMTFPGCSAWMIDGGVLDNKPFTQVSRAIEDKPADHQVFRIVIYVEPDPEGRLVPTIGPAPRPLEVLKGLFGLFRHEPIYDDLRDLYARNDRVERIRDVRDAVRIDAEKAAKSAGAEQGLEWPPRSAELGAWREITNRFAARDLLSGYGGYVSLKARCAAAVVATVICEALEYPYDARHAYFVRSLVRGWLKRHGALDPPSFAPDKGFELSEGQSQLLRAFDVPFRIRRIRALVQEVNRAYDLKPAPADRDRLDRCKAALADIAFAYEAAVREPGETLAEIAEALGDIGSDAIDGSIAQLGDDLDGTLDRFDSMLGAVYDRLVERFSRVGDELNDRIAAAIGLLPERARDEAAKALAAFPFVDLVVFPLMDTAGVTDLITVETMRISPRDASFLSTDPCRLKGRALGAFAGFLDREAREHDLMWGRLDGAERLIQLIVRASLSGDRARPEIEALRVEFTRRAMAAVLDEEAARPNSAVKSQARALKGRLPTAPTAAPRSDPAAAPVA